MNEDREALGQVTSQGRVGSSFEVSNATGIGIGKKAVLYAMGLLLLGLVLVVIVGYLTGYYAPFEGTAGVGP